jgi:hypothetical protein
MATICTRCNLDCKYPSNLKRHNERKNKCKILNDDYNDDTTKHIDASFDIKLKNIMETDVNVNEKIELLKAVIEDKNNEDNENESIRDYMCNNCNKHFANPSNLRRHHRLNRCKNININNSNANKPINEIINSTINSNNSVVNNSNNTTNTTNNYNMSLNINAFGCESIDNIEKKEVMFIFQNSKYIAYNLCDFIYVKNKDNMSFYKYNINSKSISILTPEMETQNIPEFIFRDNLKKNILEISIELFHKHKNNLTEQELCKCIENFIKYQQSIAIDKDAIEQHKEIIDTIMETLFRHSAIKTNLDNFESILNANKELKVEKIKRAKEQEKHRSKCVDEYYKKPNDNDTDQKNLNKLKAKANRNLRGNINNQNNQNN